MIANPNIMIWGIFILFMILSWVISLTLKSKFTKYSKIPLENGMSGKEVAEKMLRDNGIYDVKIESVPGQLTDHYNPVNKTINLSPEVYSGRSVSSAAVAAHETGHAVQHASAYAWLGFRSSLVPAVSFASKYVTWITSDRNSGCSEIPGPSSCRNHSFRADHCIQLHNTSCRDKCQQESPCMVIRFRYHYL